jgi:hypothetical protein
MSQMNGSHDSFTLSVDGGMFSVGFIVGLAVGKFLLKNTLLAVAFATGFGLALGTSGSSLERR